MMVKSTLNQYQALLVRAAGLSLLLSPGKIGAMKVLLRLKRYGLVRESLILHLQNTDILNMAHGHSHKLLT